MIEKPKQASHFRAVLHVLFSKEKYVKRNSRASKTDLTNPQNPTNYGTPSMRNPPKLRPHYSFQNQPNYPIYDPKQNNPNKRITIKSNREEARKRKGTMSNLDIGREISE